MTINSQETEGNQEDPGTETQNGTKPTSDSSSNEESPSPRGVLEIPVSGSDTDSSSSNTSTSSSFSAPSSPTEKSIKTQPLIPEFHGVQWKSMIDNIKKKSARRFSTIPLMVTSDLTKRALNRKLGRFRSADDQIDLDPVSPKPSWRNFKLGELKTATDNFSSDRLIGKGGNAEVYKGVLSDGQVVAVKRLLKESNGKEEKTGDFLSELGIIAHINHPNAARLIGFSVEGGLHLVLQFLPHGSLASLLFGSKEVLEWDKRFKVAKGIAEGLNYLHIGCQRRIIHRDIKASNILLTEDYEAQISDFGLAKWLPEKWTHHIVFPIEGTFGYLAPEYFMHGVVDEKTDVFAFGVLLLEIITGRHAVDSNRQSLVMWAKPLLEDNNIEGLIDPRLGDAYNAAEVKDAVLAAQMCIHHLSEFRPPMSQVVKLLKGENGTAETMGKEAKARGGRGRAPSILDGCDLDDYTCSSYLVDLNRHRELALLD